MKKLMIVSLAAASMLFAEYEVEKSVIATITKASVSSIEILNVTKANDNKSGLDEIVFKIPSSPYKNLVYRVNDKYIFGQVINKDGDNLTREKAMEINKDVIAKSMKAKASKDIVAITKVNEDKFKDIIVTLKGEAKDGKDLYLFTDPKCPFCQQFEKNELKKILKNVKSVKLVYNPLAIRGHESAGKRAAWGIPLLKAETNIDKQLEIMHKVSFSDEYKSSNNTKILEKVNSFAATGVIRGTPTLVYSDGSPFLR